MQDLVEELGALLGGDQIPICIGLKVEFNVSLVFHDSAKQAFDEVGPGSILSRKKISLESKSSRSEQDVEKVSFHLMRQVKLAESNKTAIAAALVHRVPKNRPHQAIVFAPSSPSTERTFESIQKT